MKRVLTAALTLTVSAALITAFLFGRHTLAARSRGIPPPASPLGHEAPTPGFLPVNGWNIPQNPPFAATYQSLRTYLGVPIGAFDGVSQPFWGGRLLFIPTNGPDRQVILDDLGRQMLQLKSLPYVPDSEPDPMTQRLILDAMQTGYNPQDLFSRIISPALCDTAYPKHCEQYTDKQVIEWTQGDTMAHRENLGCLLDQACSRLQFPPPPPPESWLSRFLPLVSGAVLLLLALALFVYTRLHHGTGSGDGPYGG